MASTPKLVIVDRDGTLNIDSDDYVKSADEWSPYPNALHAIARLNHAGWHVVVVTNQSGLGRGLFDMATLNAMHEKMHRALAAVGAKVDAIFFCPHTPEDACQCRKPASGLFEQVRERYGRPLDGVPNVGDSLRDLQAGDALGCESHLVLTGKGEAFRDRPLSEHFPANTRVHEDLLAFADWFLAREHLKSGAHAP